MSDAIITLSDFSSEQLVEMRLAFRDRWNKLEAIREVYGDCSDEYADASNDMWQLGNASRRFDEYLEHIGDDSATRVEPDPLVLYVAPPGVEKKVDSEQMPFGMFHTPLKIGEGP